MAGFFTRRIGNRAALAGLVCAIILNSYLGANAADLLPEGWSLPIHAYWTGIVVNLLFFLVAGIAAWIFGPSRKDLTGLTVWTLEPKSK